LKVDILVSQPLSGSKSPKFISEFIGIVIGDEIAYVRHRKKNRR
jgi:hypothetical protein